jgi:hypothetical protein
LYHSSMGTADSSKAEARFEPAYRYFLLSLTSDYAAIYHP